MFELASALFSIADANEFRFARFYIVCEAVMLGTLKSLRIVCRPADTPAECSKLGKTRIIADVKSAGLEIPYCAIRISPPASIRNAIARPL